MQQKLHNLEIENWKKSRETAHGCLWFELQEFRKSTCENSFNLQSFQQRKEGRRPNGYFSLMRQPLFS